MKLRSDLTTDAWYDLESIENTLQNQEGKEYVVKEVTDNKIILTNLITVLIQPLYEYD